MKKAIALLLALTLACALAACGQSAPQTPEAPEGNEPPVEEGGEAPVSMGLPEYSDAITTLPSETEKLPALEELIAKTWDIPEEDLGGTQYYYNYVDLNGDGVDEIFAVAVGMYTSGTGGDSALIAAQIDGKLELNQTLTLVWTPVIISDQVTNGCKEIIVPSFDSASGESHYQVLTCTDGVYTNVGDGTSVETLEGVAGTAIVYNDMTADMENSTGMTLE